MKIYEPNRTEVQFGSVQFGGCEPSLRVTVRFVFQCNNSANTRGHAYKLYNSQYANSARTNFFANMIVNVWNSLPATADFNSLAAFKRTVIRADLSAFLLCNCT